MNNFVPFNSIKEVKKAIRKHGKILTDTVLGYDWEIEIDVKDHILIGGEKESFLEMFEDFQFKDKTPCGVQLPKTKNSPKEPVTAKKRLLNNVILIGENYA